MPTYTIRCADQISHECEEDVRVRLDIVGLSEAQLERLEQGEEVELTAQQIRESELDLTETQGNQLQASGVLRYAIDIDSVCDACGGHYAAEVDEFLISS